MNTHPRYGDSSQGIDDSPHNNTRTRILSKQTSLGSHDLSLMREALGSPIGVLGSHLHLPIWTVLFQYPSFALTYESGFDDVPRFDAHLEIFGKRKTVKVQYDTPYVKGLPIIMTVREAVEGDLGAYQERTVRRTYEDPYTLELKQLWEMVVNGKPAKTTAEDARKDLEIFGMMVRAAETGRMSSRERVGSSEVAGRAVAGQLQ